MRKFYIIIAVMLLAATLLGAASCGEVKTPEPTQTNNTENTGNSGNITPQEGNKKDLTVGIKAVDFVSGEPISEEDRAALAKIYVEIFKRTLDEDKGSSLVSPLSVITALGMAADGASGNTLKQMEKAFGLTAEQLDRVMAAYRKATEGMSDKAKFEAANSIWFSDREDFHANSEYIARVLGAYDPSLYTVDFTDPRTVDEINSWVSEHTDEMIKRIINELSPKTVAVLINALVFDARWAQEYEKYQVSEGKFNAYGGEKNDVEFMYSVESTYYDFGNADGFAKYYAGGKFRFVAILPDENVDIFDFISSLDEKKLTDTLRSPETADVYAAIPKFSYDYDLMLNDMLKSIGITDAFGPYEADFSEMATVDGGNIYISKVIHKTHIEVDEGGTKAAAVTAIVMDATECIEQRKTVSVKLDRPFVYMIVDNEYDLPVFMGVVTEVKQ